MGLIAKVIDFVRSSRNDAKVSDVKTDPGGGAVQTNEHFQPPGVDAHPLPSDFVLLVSIQGAGRYSAAGYLDPLNEQTAQAGEHRTYARAEDGTQVAQIWLKNDGTILINNDAVTHTISPDGTARTENDAGYFELQPSGTVEANGATIPTNGDVITASGISLDNHVHPQAADSAGNAQEDTGAPK